MNIILIHPEREPTCSSDGIGWSLSLNLVLPFLNVEKSKRQVL
jgi:hypothetical protein